MKKPALQSKDQVTLWLHRRSMFEMLRTSDERGGQPPTSYQPLDQVFGVMPALRTDRGLVPLTPPELDDLGGFEPALELGLRNAVATVSQVAVSERVVMVAQPGAEVVALGSVAFARQFGLVNSGQVVAMVPCEGVVLLADPSNELGLAELLHLALAKYAGSSEFRSLRALSWVEGEEAPREWLPTEGHPLRAAFRRAAAKTLVHEAQGLAQVYASDAAPLGHLAPTDQGLVVGWSRGSDVVVPFVERVVLFDDDQPSFSRVEVGFGTLRALFPAAVEALPIDRATSASAVTPKDEQVTALFRLVGERFPTVLERRFLGARLAFTASGQAVARRMVPPAELFAEWDGGAPLAFRREGPERVELEAIDGRVARLAFDAFDGRVTLPPEDDRRLRAKVDLAQRMAQMFKALGRADDVRPQSKRDFTQSAREHEALAPPVEVPDDPTLVTSAMVRGAARALGKPSAQESESVETQLLSGFSLCEPALLFPAVRPPGFEVAAAANLRGMVDGAHPGAELLAPATLRRAAAEGLTLELVINRGNQMLVLTEMHVAAAMRERVWRTMALNVAAASLQGFEPVGPGWYVGPWRDSYDFARVLMQPGLVGACEVKGAPLVFAPLVSQVWVTGDDDLPAMTVVLDAIDALLASGEALTPYQYRELLFGWPWTVRDGALVRWSVPEGHALAARIAALDALLERRRENSRSNVEGYARAAMRPGGNTDAKA